MTAVGSHSASTPVTPPAARSHLRAVAIPSEHGGWGLTAEPIVLGLAVAPSTAGVLIGAAGMVAFCARTPLKLALADASRHRLLPRTVAARWVAAAELIVLAALSALAVQFADAEFWAPVAIAAPLFGVELWFDMQSRGRRLLPELAGAVGICALSAMIVLAAGGPAGLAAGLWLVLAARVLTAIPFIRSQVAALHGRGAPAWPLAAFDACAVATATAAAAFAAALVAGAGAVCAVVALQRLSTLAPTPRPAVLGIRQMALGFGVVAATWLGVLLTGAVVS